MKATKHLTIAVVCFILYHAAWIAAVDQDSGPRPLARPLHLSLLYFLPIGSAVLGAVLLFRINEAGIREEFRWMVVIGGAAVAPLLGLQCVAVLACALLGQCL